MNKTPPKTLYGKIVFYKKKFFVKRWIPETIAHPIDTFFNSVVSAKDVAKDTVITSMELTRDGFIKTRDLTRDSLIRSKDLARDSIIKTKDVTRDSLIKSKDLTKDSLIRSRDLTRDNIIKTKDITRDSLCKSKDVARDNLIKSKDLTKDSLIRSRDLTRDSLIRSKDLARDNIIKTKDVTRDSLVKTKNITKEASIKEREEVKKKLYSTSKSLRFYYIKFLFTFLYSFIMLLITVISKRKYTITEKSDKQAVEEIDTIIANSTNIKNKIAVIYNREAKVVYPPVDVHKITRGGSRGNGGYWLSVSRLEPYKRIEMQLKAFGMLPDERLIIVGEGDSHNKNYEDRLSVMAPYNVTFVGSVTEDELVEYYLAAKGLITTTKNEDFGMTAVEAMAAGKPVIAPNDGGYKETVNETTGILLDNIDEFKIAKAIQKINENIMLDENYYVNSCIKNANNYTHTNFITQIRNLIVS